MTDLQGLEAALNRFLEAGSWPEAIGLVAENDELRDRAATEALAAGATEAAEAGDDQQAAVLRRHAAVLTAVRTSGTQAGLDEAARRPDPREPKDTEAWKQLLGTAVLGPAEELPTILDVHPELLSDYTDDLLRQMETAALDSPERLVPDALLSRFRRLLLQRCGRVGAAAAVAEIHAVGSYEERLGQLTAAADADSPAGDLTSLDERLEIRLALFWLVADGPEADLEPMALNLGQVGAILVARFHHSADRADLRLGIAAYRVAMNGLMAELQVGSLPDELALLLLAVTGHLAKAMLLWENSTGDSSDRRLAIELFRFQRGMVTPDHPDWLSATLDLVALQLAEFREHGYTEEALDAVSGLIHEVLAQGEVDEGEDRLNCLVHLAAVELLRFARTRVADPAYAAVTAATDHLDSLPLGSRERRRYAEALAGQLNATAQATGDRRLIDATVHVFETAADPSGLGPPRADSLISLADALVLRHQLLGDVADVDAALRAAQRGIEAAGGDQTLIGRARDRAGVAFRSRFGHSGSMVDLDQAIEALTAAVDDLLGQPTGRIAMSNLGGTLLERFHHSRQPADLATAVQVYEQLVAATEAPDPARTGRIAGLGEALRLNALHADRPGDLSRAVDLLEAELAGSPNPAFLLSVLTNLSLCLRDRFMKDGRPADLERSTLLMRSAVEGVAPTAPIFDHLLMNYLQSLVVGPARERRLAGLPDADLRAWPVEQLQPLRDRCLRTGDVPAALAALVPPPDLVEGGDDVVPATTPADDPNGMIDDKRIVTFDPLLGRVRAALPDPLVVYGDRGRVAMARFSESDDPADIVEAVANFQATLDHPRYGEADPASRRVTLLLAGLARHGAHDATGSLIHLDGLLDCYRQILVLTDEPGDRADVAIDTASARLDRFDSTADVGDLDQAFELLASAIAALPVGSRRWRRALRYLFAIMQRYPETASLRAQHIGRLDRWLEELGPDATGDPWYGARLKLLQWYPTLRRSPVEWRDGLQRSVEIAKTGEDLARQAGDAKMTEAFVEIGRMAGDQLGRTEPLPEPVEVNFSELVREADADPETRRQTIDALRAAADRLRPDTDYQTWRNARMTLISLLAQDSSEARADYQDEAIGLGQALLDESDRQDDRVTHELTLAMMAESLESRLHGSKADNLNRAVDYAERGVAVRQPGTAEWAIQNSLLGFVLSQRVGSGRPRPDDHRRAVAACREAISVLDAQRDPHAWAVVHFRYGNVLSRAARLDGTDRDEDPITAYLAALESATPDTDLWANVHHQLGSAYANGPRSEDDQRRAIGHYLQELTFFTRDRHPVDWALAKLGLGNAYSQIRGGDPERTAALATAAFEEAAEVFTRNADPANWGRVQVGLGLLAMDADGVGGRPIDPERGVSLLTAALEVNDQQLSPIEWARIHGYLGAAELMVVQSRKWPVPADGLTRLEHAEESIRRALTSYESQNSTVDRGRALTVLGAVSAARADLVPSRETEFLAEAAGSWETARAIFRTVDARPEIRDTAINLTMVYERLTWWRQCVTAFEAGIAAAEAGYAGPHSDAARSIELERTQLLIRRGVRALIEVGRVADALIAMERGRARGLGDSLAEERADLRRLEIDHPELAAGFRSAAEQVRAAESAERRPAADAEVPDRTRQARLELAARTARIKRLDGFERFLDLPGRADVARILQPGHPLVYLMPTGDSCLILMATKAAGDFEAQWRNAPGMSLARLDRLLFDNANSYLPMAQGARAESFRPVLDRTLDLLGSTLMAEVAALVRDSGATAVTLIAGGRLALLPLHAARYDHDGASTCLLDEVAVSYAPSAWVLAHRHQRPTGEPALTGVGNPTGDLSFAAAELDDVANLFPRRDPERLLFGPGATRRALVGRLPGATHVHLACHGRYDPASPLDSALLLAGGDVLALRELLDGQLLRDARLVVASACQTAVTDFARLPDEAVGLPAGFLRAGADAVIGTLWPVADLPTSLLMERFYRGHLIGDPEADRPAPMEPLDALRAAQRWLAGMTGTELAAIFAGRKVERTPGDQEKPFEHPYFWAPFVLAGY